jgi:hypothetical protein
MPQAREMEDVYSIVCGMTRLTLTAADTAFLFDLRRSRRAAGTGLLEGA